MIFIFAGNNNLLPRLTPLKQTYDYLIVPSPYYRCLFPHIHFHLNNVSISIRTLPLLVFALCLNGVGIGGEQVAGVVDALHEAV